MYSPFSKAVLLLIFFSLIGAFAKEELVRGEQDPLLAVAGLLQRHLPDHAEFFELSLIPPSSATGFEVFEYEGVEGNHIALRGSNGVALASALHWYLKDYNLAHISWTGDRLELPDVLPHPPLRRVERESEFTYYQNTCTTSYSFVWWNFDRWEREIDWMALNGVNMPLAFTGQEYVFQRVYESFGLSIDDLVDYFAGPAFLTWQRMGNVDGWGGPLPQEFIDDQAELQIKILNRMRSFGMRPVLPAFDGRVPRALGAYYPDANVQQTGSWVGFAGTYLLASDDPLFVQLGTAFIHEQTELYGTDHLYNCDTFNENIPPSNDTTYLRSIAGSVYQAMAEADNEAVWVMQAWLFYFDSPFWQLPQIEALLSGVPDDKMILLDLWTEVQPVWDFTESFFGKPFIWNMLENFGGRFGMHGRIETVAENPVRDLHDAASTMVGVGITTEAIYHNYIVFDLLLEMGWRSQSVDLDEWLYSENGWVARRYGPMNQETKSSLDEAWELLRRSVLQSPISNIGNTPLTALPNLDPAPGSGDNEFDHFAHIDVMHESAETLKKWRLEARQNVFEAWELFVKVADPQNPVAHTQTFRHDLVDITREVLTEQFREFRRDFSDAYYDSDMDALLDGQHKLLGLINDLDRLLATNEFFLLGEWVSDARTHSRFPEGQDYMEFNARNQVTLWGNGFNLGTSELNDYASKHWAGLMKDYYGMRYQMFTDAVIMAVSEGAEHNQDAYRLEVNSWAWDWNHRTDGAWTVVPVGDSIGVANELFQKYSSF